MNLYIRYFNEETLVKSVDEALAFLANLNIADFSVDEALTADIVSFVESPLMYPKRHKVHPRAYFIIIKTMAETLDEFKDNKHYKIPEDEEVEPIPFVPAAPRSSFYTEEQKGWYEASFLFKRVVPIGNSNKFQYVDTFFSAQLKADSVQHCYDRMLDYLKNRQDVDLRSQFPSIKGKNFNYSYLGEKRIKIPSDETCDDMK
ncbi:MAG: hypothetical protein RR280_02865 [Bacteroidaceae bacterium]